MDQPADTADQADIHKAVERRGDREIVISRVFDARPGIVFRAWSEADLFMRWWLPKSISGIMLTACKMDVRTGGKYRLEFNVGGSETMSFFGKYLEVVPNQRIIWTNDEGDDGDGAITTVTFEDLGGKTRVTFHEIYPSPGALEDALQGSAAGLPEQLAQLGELISSIGE